MSGIKKNQRVKVDLSKVKGERIILNVKKEVQLKRESERGLLRKKEERRKNRMRMKMGKKARKIGALLIVL